MIHPTQCNRVSTWIPSIDFETYSEAGYELKAHRKSLHWEGKGITDVGADAYAAHPSTRVVCLAYDLSGQGPKLWTPDMPPPTDLFSYLSSGGKIAAWNCSFEFLIWHYVCHKRMGWPELHMRQMVDDMAKAYAYGGPGALADAGEFFQGANLKDPKGKRLITKCCCPQWGKLPSETDLAELGEYCLQDVRAEAQISQGLPDLSPEEQEIWDLDFKINMRGVFVDIESLEACERAYARAYELGTIQLHKLTNWGVESIESGAQLIAWLASQGVNTASVDKENVARLLVSELTPAAREVLELREKLGQSSVKKLAAIRNRVQDGRIRGLFAYMGASKTGRWAGRGPQPQNLPSSTVEDFEAAIAGLPTDPDPISTIAGCLRGLFCAAPGHDLICSDFSAIEAVVLAELSGEAWRQEVFRGHGKIYEESASRITGIPFQEFLDHKKSTGEHHPMRKKVGKIAELASGYGGGVEAWKRFGASEHIGSDELIKEKITQWRQQSPMIVQFWRGLEAAAVQAVLNPGVSFNYRSISYEKRGDVLLCKLPSGRFLHYHKPRAEPGQTPWGTPNYSLSFLTFDKIKGGVIRERTYGGRLTENVVQAVSRDIQAASMLRLERAGYSVVLHVHDEIVSEVPKGWGSVQEFEAIMGMMPAWALGWPVRAGGGWRGKRYRK